jgi:hypothetical protein
VRVAASGFAWVNNRVLAKEREEIKDCSTTLLNK